MKKTPPRQAKKPSANRERLIAVALDMFGTQGFANTGTEDIVAGAGITRGVLYYQFENKEDLFRAVFERTLQQVGEEIFVTTMNQLEDDIEDLQIGTQVMLDVFSRPKTKQIVLLDGPTVLGWALWREIQRPFHLTLITHALEHLVDAKALKKQPLEPLADVIAGAAMQAALAIATSETPEETRKIYGQSLSQLIERLTYTS